MYLWGGAMDKKYQNKKILSLGLEINLYLAKRKGYNTAVGFATNPKSSSVGSKLGFEKLA